MVINPHLNLHRGNRLPLFFSFSFVNQVLRLSATIWVMTALKCLYICTCSSLAPSPLFCPFFCFLSPPCLLALPATFGQADLYLLAILRFVTSGYPKEKNSLLQKEKKVVRRSMSGTVRFNWMIPVRDYENAFSKGSAWMPQQPKVTSFIPRFRKQEIIRNGIEIIYIVLRNRKLWEVLLPLTRLRTLPVTSTCLNEKNSPFLTCYQALFGWPKVGSQKRQDAK